MRPDGPGDDQLDEERRPRHVLHEELLAGDERRQQVPRPRHEDEDEAVGHEVEPPPEPVLVQQRVHRRAPEVDPDEGGDHVDEDQDAGEQDDPGVERRVHRPPGDGRDRQRNEVLRLPASEEVPDRGDPERRGEQGACRLLLPSLGRVGDRRVDVEDEERRPHHHQGDPDDEEGAADQAELGEVGREGPVQGVERRVVREEAGQPEDEGPHREEAAGPVGQLDAPQRLLHQERDEEQERAADDGVGRAEDADQRVGGQDGEELVLSDEGKGRHLVRPHQHPLDHGKTVVQEADHDEPERHLLHRRQRVGLEQPLLAGNERLKEGHGVHPIR